MRSVPKSSLPNRAAAWAALPVAAIVLYVLSSGPVLATGFWLREATGWNGFYAVMLLYYPLLVWGHWEPLDWYVTWWCWLLDAVGPG